MGPMVSFNVLCKFIIHVLHLVMNDWHVQCCDFRACLREE